jgi:hypothetical protein
MASTNRGGGPGTSDKHGVRTPMNSPFSKGTNKGSQDTMKGPFNAPRTGGDNGLPTTLYDDSMRGPGRSAGRSTRDDLGTILTDPHNRDQRV